MAGEPEEGEWIRREGGHSGDNLVPGVYEAFGGQDFGVGWNLPQLL